MGRPVSGETRRAARNTNVHDVVKGNYSFYGVRAAGRKIKNRYCV
jgi:hypothetical protein